MNVDYAEYLEARAQAHADRAEVSLKALRKYNYALLTLESDDFSARRDALATYHDEMAAAKTAAAYRICEVEQEYANSLRAKRA